MESADKQFVQAQKQVQQSIGEKRVYKQNIQNFTKQLRQANVNGILRIPRIAKSAINCNPEKFNGDKTKLEVFLAQLNLKL